MFSVLSLCSGAGGLDLGVELAIPTARPVCYVEVEAYACEVLASRMEEGALAPAPLWSDLRTFDGHPWRGVVDLVAGGVPCQSWSVAGKRRGKRDPRHLWPEFKRILGECEAPFALVENVPGLVCFDGLGVIARELHAMGYRVAAGLFSADEVGAPHLRKRVFVLAYSEDNDTHQAWQRVADASSRGRAGQGLHVQPGRPRQGDAVPARRGTEGGGQAVADAARQPQREPERQQAAVPREDSRDESRGRGFDMGDAHHPRSQGRRLREDGGPDQRAAWPPSSPLVGTAVSSAQRVTAPYPPHPDDLDGWKHYLVAYPHLAPAVESPEPRVRGGVDGLAGGLVDGDCLTNRLDRLRLTGNGVVPGTAALAIRTLFHALQEEVAHAPG